MCSSDLAKVLGLLGTLRAAVISGVLSYGLAAISVHFLDRKSVV